jgi:hypothetical protein
VLLWSKAPKQEWRYEVGKLSSDENTVNTSSAAERL